MEKVSNELIEQAKQGSKMAFEQIIKSIQNQVYGLSLRMLYDPIDAEDASQEILLKIVTHLATFKGKSSFETWVYRVTCNHLLNIKKKQSESSGVSFKEYQEDLDIGTPYLWDDDSSNPMQNLIVEEIRIGCLQGLLLCLNREERLVYLLAEIFYLTGEQGGEILDITPENFRKKLSRSRKRVHNFLLTHCSLVNPNNLCQCDRYAAKSMSNDLRSQDLVFAGKGCQARSDSQMKNYLKEMDELNRIKEVFNSYSNLNSSVNFVGFIRDLISSESFNLISS